MEVTHVGEDGITMHGNLYEDFNNVYGIAHGGYLYTVAHMAAEVCGELCLGGSWQVRSAECLFLHPLRNFPSVIHGVWISKDPAYPMVRAEVHDSKGALCFELNAALAPAWPAPAAAVRQIPKITTENMLPICPHRRHHICRHHGLYPRHDSGIWSQQRIRGLCTGPEGRKAGGSREDRQ